MAYSPYPVRYGLQISSGGAGLNLLKGVNRFTSWLSTCSYLSPLAHAMACLKLNAELYFTNSTPVYKEGQ